MEKDLLSRIKESVAFLNDNGIRDLEVGVILGTDLNDYADRIEDPVTISYNDIPNMQAGQVSSHRGQMVFGTYLGKKVLIMAGRFHYYESRDMEKAAYPARVMVALGVKRFILTNSAGSINRDFGMGKLMLISDHINYSGNNPLMGPNLDEYGPRFPDMTYIYNKELRDALKEKAAAEGIELCEGVYMMFTGPSFETHAEIRFARTVGADAAGMSTVPEAIIANHAGCEIIGISFLANMAAGVIDEPISGKAMAEAGAAIKPTFAKVVDLAIAL